MCNYVFTGELIGVQYLYSQTGQVLQDLALDDENAEGAVQVEQTETEDSEEDEGFDEEEDPTIAPVEDVVYNPPRRGHSRDPAPVSTPPMPRTAQPVRPIVQLPVEEDSEPIAEPTEGCKSRSISFQ